MVIIAVVVVGSILAYFYSPSSPSMHNFMMIGGGVAAIALVVAIAVYMGKSGAGKPS